MMGIVRARDDELRSWLLAGDPAVRWRVFAQLDDAPDDAVDAERERVATVGWGARLLDVQDAEGTWSGALYSPKWVSTTYTLLHLMWLGLPGGHPAAHRGLERLWEWRSRWREPETCIESMLIRLTAAFAYPTTGLDALVDDLLAQQQDDGGWFPEWHFDVLRGLELFATLDVPDARLADALDLVRSRRRSDGRWHTYAPYAGRHWFRLEEPRPSRWTTVRALAVLRWWDTSPAPARVA